MWYNYSRSPLLQHSQPEIKSCTNSLNTALEHIMQESFPLQATQAPPDEEKIGYLNSIYESGIKSPLDEAILQHGTLDVGGYSKIGEIPFDFERRCLSVVVRHEDTYLLIIKGAPESILPRCTEYEIAGERKPLDGVDGKARTKGNCAFIRYADDWLLLTNGSKEEAYRLRDEFQTGAWAKTV